jgi:hypothetical protein
VNGRQSLAITLLAVAGCSEDSNATAADASEATAANESNGGRARGESMTRDILASELSARGLDYLGGRITGLTSPTITNGSQIAEGTPLVATVYFGRKAGPGLAEDRQYSCQVPEEFQFRPDRATEAQRGAWLCRKIDR